MKVSNIMSCRVVSVTSTERIANAAALMADRDVGSLPVVDDGRLMGIVTDRDLVVRGLAAGLHPGAPVFRAMSRNVISCHPDDELAQVLKTMAEHRIRRIPVCSVQGELLGIISIGDAACEPEYGGEAVETLADLCRPRGGLFQGRSAVQPVDA